MRTVERLARTRAKSGSSTPRGDGLERLGAPRALEQLATDLDITADKFERHPQKIRRR